MGGPRRTLQTIFDRKMKPYTIVRQEASFMSQYNQVTPEIIAQLQAAAPGHVAVGADVNPDYARDEMPIYGVKLPEVSLSLIHISEPTRR